MYILEGYLTAITFFLTIYMQGKLKTNWSDHFGVVENVLDTDSVMSLQKNTW